MTQGTPPRSVDEILKACQDKPGADTQRAMQASRRNSELTKPGGSLGMLEDLAIWYSSWRDVDGRGIRRIQVAVFAGNHGIAARGVSAYPAEVTAQMVKNFRTGGAAINQLVDQLGANLEVVALDIENPTRDFTEDPAMEMAEFIEAFGRGWASVDGSADLLVLGEMGIGNTTSASAICHALLGGKESDWVGCGTGISDEQLDLKQKVIGKAIDRHRDILDHPLEVLRCMGGRELVAMAGAMLAARHGRIPVILDGFICTSAALPLYRCQSDILDHAIVGHVSAEQAHGRVVEAIGMVPVLDLGMRLGEGTGAAIAAYVLKCAVACHQGMATFAEAGVADT